MWTVLSGEQEVSITVAIVTLSLGSMLVMCVFVCVCVRVCISIYSFFILHGVGPTVITNVIVLHRNQLT